MLIKKKVSENGTGSRSPLQDVGDVGVPPHLNFLEQKKNVSNGILFTLILLD